MAVQEIRVGIVGAGANTRAKHIPKLQAIPGVRIVAVCNRRAESTLRVAREFGIPTTYEAWEALVADERLDAVVIGTWPNLHAPVTLAALEAGKHVLTEARMAATAAEARAMLRRARASGLVAQVVPSPIGLEVDPVVRELMADGYVGEVREVFVRSCSAQWADPAAPLHWRQRRDLSGVNMLALGIVHETLTRWVGETVRVWADACVFTPRRHDPESGTWVAADLPDSLRVLTELAGGGRGLYHLSAVTHFVGGNGIAIYGTDGTLVYDAQTQSLLGARVGEDSQLAPLAIPPEKRGGWTVEADFIAAIRGERPIGRTTFEDGVAYMEFTEAVYRSARRHEPVALPLEE